VRKFFPPIFLLALLSLTGCADQPIVTKTVEVRVEVAKLVPLDAALTKPCTYPQLAGTTVGDLLNYSIDVSVALEDCAGRMEKVDGLQRAGGQSPK
jgi:hypothetical protein